MKTISSLTHLCLRRLCYRLPPWMPASIQEENAALLIQRYWRKFAETHKVYTDSRYIYVASDMVDYNNDPLYIVVGPKTLFIWYAHLPLIELPGCRVSKRIVQRLIELIFSKLRL